VLFRSALAAKSLRIAPPSTRRNRPPQLEDDRNSRKHGVKKVKHGLHPVSANIASLALLEPLHPACYSYQVLLLREHFMEVVTSVTSKGQVTIPLKLRQQLGIRAGSKVMFQWVGDHLEVRVKSNPSTVPTSGFGMLKSKRKSVPVDFDPANLLKP
jgi:AbrB family looped-hinge helix DNA binding protein